MEDNATAIAQIKRFKAIVAERNDYIAELYPKLWKRVKPKLDGARGIELDKYELYTLHKVIQRFKL